MSEKTKGELLKEKLFYKSKNGYDTMSEEKISEAYDFCEGYREYLDNGKTEREVADETVKILEANGFIAYEFGKKYNAGDAVYINNRGKYIIAAKIGTKTADAGVDIIAAHIDSPRIDLKQRPVYEDGGFAFFKTHYYGGVKKYQWVTIPLALHGVVVRADGESVKVNIGEDCGDPVFCITDLLPHLAKDQMTKTMSDAITGEGLNILIGSRPYKDEKVSDNKIKLNILNLLNEKYGITESDFISAELCLVPAAKAADIGFDRSLLGAYGHDDRICAYPPLMALVDAENPDKTAVLILADKEEIGSEGNTGMQSHIFRDFITDLAEMQGVCKKTTFMNSKCLSADVNAAFDPLYPEVYDSKNSAYANCGVVMTKYTGSRGKSGSSDASAEFVGYVRKLFDDNEIVWQTSELGKVDQGGGGTVAAYIANHNIDVVDIGVPILSMHAPMEVASKLDIFMMYEAARVFFG